MPYSKVASLYQPPLPDHHTYIAAARVHPENMPTLTVLNVYTPPARWAAGQGTQDQARQPEGLNIPTHCVIAGDVNAHSLAWDVYQPKDALGQALEEWATDCNLTCLNDGDPTRINPATGGCSTPDISLVTGEIASGGTWHMGQDIGSHHLPAVITLPAAPPKPKRRGKGCLAIKRASWPRFRTELDNIISHWPENPDGKETVTSMDSRLCKAIMTAAKRTISFDNGGDQGSLLEREVRRGHHPGQS